MRKQSDFSRIPRALAVGVSNAGAKKPGELPEKEREELRRIITDIFQEKMKKQWLAKSLTYEQYQSLVRKAKDEAWEELSIDDQTNIIETAKVSATDILIPQLRQLGFRNIRIDYREDFDIMDIIREKR